MQVTEIKHHLDGRIERFTCDVAQLQPAKHAILRYVGHRDKPLRDGPLYLPAGEISTLAFFWEDRNFLVYKLMSPDGVLLGHRFDICEDVRITPEKIQFVDLLLDLWVDPSGQIHVLDDNEVEEYRSLGMLTPSQLKIIHEAKHFVLNNYCQILVEIAHAT